jgi:hypothetical protein
MFWAGLNPDCACNQYLGTNFMDSYLRDGENKITSDIRIKAKVALVFLLALASFMLLMSSVFVYKL